MSECNIDVGQIRASVSAIKEVAKKWDESRKSIGGKKSLLEEVGDDPKIYLQISLKKIPKLKKTMMVRIKLPHPVWTDQSEVCLFTKNLDKKKPACSDCEKTITHYKEILEEHGVKCVNEVVPLYKLLTEYKIGEERKNLCSGTDIFVAENTVLDRVIRFLGKDFFSDRKIPRRINMKARNLKAEFENALSTTILLITGRGPTATTEIARCSNSVEEITSNIVTACNELSSKIPGGWENIQALHIKTAKSLAVPLYFSASGSKIKITNNPVKQAPLVDELTTLENNQKIEMYPNGYFRVVPDPNADSD